MKPRDARTGPARDEQGLSGVPRLRELRAYVRARARGLVNHAIFHRGTF